MTPQQPQHDVTQVRHMDMEDGDRFTFLGRAYDLDLYWTNYLRYRGRIVGPSILNHVGPNGWISYDYEPGGAITLRDMPAPVVHVGVHHMCEMHRLFEEHKDLIANYIRRWDR